MNQIKIGLFVAFLFANLSRVQASEIDSFTKRYESRPDSSRVIDQLASKHLSRALDLANEKNKCSKPALYKALRKHFQVILFKGQFMLDMMSSKEIIKRAIPRADSIYQYHTKKDGYLLVRPAADRDGIGMGAMIQYQDLYIGTDKFEHFFGRGYIYFYEHFINKRPIENVLAQSTNDEKTLLGGMWFLTGIFSYADLVANLNGMRFWNDFLKDHKDLLGRELEPVVKCENRKWVVNRDIHFADYIDAGLDEAVNCIQTSTENGTKGILKSLAELQAAEICISLLVHDGWS